MKYPKRLPLVSVVMPVYNAQDYLEEAIDSILAQTYKRFEFIIVDDASTDTSGDIIRRYQKKYPQFIKVITMSKNKNCGGDVCANEGLKKAKGKYIARMDADDIAHPQRLAKQVEFLESNKSVFLVGSNAHVIDKKGKIMGSKIEPLSPTDIYNSYFTFHPLIHPTCMFRRIIKGKPFLYKIEFNANNDYLSFFTLLCKGHIFVNLEEKLLYYRIHGKNDTFNHMKRKFFNTLRIRLQMITKFGYRPSLKALAICVIQTGIIVIFPEKLLLNAYLMAKGIVNKKSTPAPVATIMQRAKTSIQFS